MDSLALQCRLCAEFKNPDVLTHIKNENELEQKISLCLDISFTDKTLPKHVCRLCCSKVSDAYDFREQVRKCQIYLICLEETIPELMKDDIESDFKIEDSVFDIGEDLKLDCDDWKEKLQQINEDELKLSQIIDDKAEQDFALSKFERKHKRPTKRKLDSVESKHGVVKRKYVRTGKYSENRKRRSLLSDPEKAKMSQERSQIIKMVQQEWKNYKWICCTCQIEMTKVESLREHFGKVHNQECRYTCIECSKTYDNYNNFKRHVAVHRNRFKYRCEVCNQYFARRRNYRYHLETHSLVKNYMCAQCGKHYKTLSTLNSHLRTHVKPSSAEFECELCFKKLASKKGLANHKKTHTGHREFTCELCGKSFMSAGSLKYHMQSAHSDERPYCCEHCQRTFKHKDLLNVHLQVHSDKRPHECQVCGKKFHRKSTLNRHFSVHTGVLPYSCEYCHKKFRTKESMRVHVRQHTGERPYSCAECNHHFSDSGNYVKHMKGKHGVLTTRKDVTYRTPPEEKT